MRWFFWWQNFLSIFPSRYSLRLEICHPNFDRFFTMHVTINQEICHLVLTLVVISCKSASPDCSQCILKSRFQDVRTRLTLIPPCVHSRPYRLTKNNSNPKKHSWEKLNRGVSKPGGFPLFSGKVQIVSRTLFLVGALNRPRKRKGTNRENPRTIPEQIGENPGKIGESPKNDKKGRVQIGKPPRWKPPRLTAPRNTLHTPCRHRMICHRTVSHRVVAYPC